MRFKKYFIILFSLAFLILTGLCGCKKFEGDTADMRKNSNDDIQIRTDVEPIYNHFPTLPKTETIRWCSVSSEGIGLTTVELHVFAQYDTTVEIDNFLESVTLSDDTSKIDSIFVPDFVEQNETWKKIKTDRAFFQDGIEKTSLKYPAVYVNSKYNIIYFYSIFD